MAVSWSGSRTRWTSVRKVKEGKTANDIFAFLTTEPNKLIGAFPESDAGHPDDAAGDRRVNERAAFGGAEAPTTAAGRCADDRGQM
jgi:hypothetical protein